MRILLALVILCSMSVPVFADPAPIEVSATVWAAMPAQVTVTPGRDKRRFRAWALWFMATRLADAYTTNRALAQGGREVNPLFRSVVHNPAGDYALAVAAGFVVPAALQNCRGYDYRTMELLTLASGIAPVWNATQIRW